jgi:CHAD domain-containing protein
VSAVMKKKRRRGFERDLRWMGHVLGAQRDLDVLYLKIGPMFDEYATGQLDTVMEQLRRRRDRQRRSLQRALDSRRYRELVRRLSSAVLDPPLTSRASQSSRTILLPELREVFMRLDHRVTHLDPSPTNAELHAVRVMVKKLRYSVELSGSFLGERAHELSSSLAELQGVLGTVHDHCAALSYLDTVVASRARHYGDLDASHAPLVQAYDSLTSSVEAARANWRELYAQVRIKSEPLLLRNVDDLDNCSFASRSPR